MCKQRTNYCKPNWHIIGMEAPYGLAPLRDALHTNRWKQPAPEQTSGDFLTKKYLTGDPVRMYVTFRVWNEYLGTREYAGHSYRKNGWQNCKSSEL